MDEVIVLMVFIWVIGFLIACGMHNENCDAAQEQARWFHYLPLFVFWPDYVGRHLAG